MTNDSPFFDDREHIFENSVGFVILDRYPQNARKNSRFPDNISTFAFD